MTLENTKIKFPLWEYLNQSLFKRNTHLILNPRRFAFVWRTQLLERCWQQKCDKEGHQQH
jgi:hypothetical protein